MRLRKILPDLSRVAADPASDIPPKPARRHHVPGRAFALLGGLAACAALVLGGPGCAKYEPGTLPAVRAVTTDAAWDGDAAPSPDGRRIAFVSERESGRRALFVRELSGGEPRRLYAFVGGELSQPAWFPDGKRILVTRVDATGGAALVVDASGSGGEPRALGVPGSDVRDAALDRDGANVAAIVRDDSTASLVLVRLADFAVTPLVRGSLYDAPSQPTWLPKDRGIVFEWRGDLWWTAAGAGVPRNLTPGPARELDPALSPDGKWLAFASDSLGGGVTNLWVARVSGPKRDTPLTLAPWRPVTASFETARRPAWEKNGRALWFDRQDPWAVVARDFDGGSVDTLSSSLFDSYEPTFTGDGSFVAFGSNRNGAGDVWLLDARGEAKAGPAKQLTRDPARERMASVSKASGQVVFSIERGAFLGTDLALTDVVGAELGAITDGAGDDADPAWSPDGRTLAFASDRTGTWQLYRLDGVGRVLSQVPLGAPAGEPREPSWTPDGQALVFSARSDARRSIWRIPALGGVAVAITTDAVDGSWDADPVVAPDGAHALFTRVRRGDADLWSLDLASGEARVWFENPKGLDRHADWSPDGRRVVWQTGGAVNLYRADLPPVLRP
jgi:Tol biopolymer transport system component